MGEYIFPQSNKGKVPILRAARLKRSPLSIKVPNKIPSTLAPVASSASDHLPYMNRKSPMRIKPLRFVGLVTAVGLVYLLAARLGLSLASVHTNVSPVWPPTGVAIASLLLFGRSLWPAILLGAFVANLWTGVSIPTALGIAVGNTLEAVVAVT